MSSLEAIVNKSLTVIILAGTMMSCAIYKQDVMFRPGENFKGSTIQQEQLKAERNYVIQPNDILQLEVLANNGERLIDPNRELLKSQGGGMMATNRETFYTVNADGSTKLPMLDTLHLANYTIREAEQILQQAYNKFYKECFVQLSFQNKRVVVLGAGGGQVIPLINENIRLSEILALSRSITKESKANNIRLMRNDDVYLIDFSTIDGVLNGNMVVQPNDIIYVEPWRRPLMEGIRDFSSIGGFIVGIGTLVIVLISSSDSTK